MIIFNIQIEEKYGNTKKNMATQEKCGNTLQIIIIFIIKTAV